MPFGPRYERDGLRMLSHHVRKLEQEREHKKINRRLKLKVYAGTAIASFVPFLAAILSMLALWSVK